MNILQVVRRFGPVGGMERYVFELSRELASAGHRLQVLCETDLSSGTLPNVTIHSLGSIRPKPRWLSHIKFSNRVHTWLQRHHQSDMIIHSHERIQDHHITTFHGPPFAQVRNLPLWKRLSLRAAMNLWLENRELCTPCVQTVVPNSMHIARQLKQFYPSITERLSEPVVPGVNPGPKRKIQEIASNAGVIGFIGKEWKRKGLDIAVKAVATLAQLRPDLSFMVAGPLEKDLRHLFESADFNYTLLGEIDAQQLYPQIDVLLHPARQEPYGMVIIEALSAGVPVVISDVCGATTEVTNRTGAVLSLSDPADHWAKAIDKWLSSTDHNINYNRGWHEVAMEYEHLYKSIQLQPSHHQHNH